MADHTKIEWTDASWNPIRARNIESGGIGHFCVHASPGCANCYAERMQPRFGNQVRFVAQDAGKIVLFLDEKMLLQPLRWKKPRMIFVCSMTDLFADFVPDEWIDRVFAVMALCPQHTFQVLTKRSKRMREYCHRFADGALAGPVDEVCRTLAGRPDGGYDTSLAKDKDHLRRSIARCGGSPLIPRALQNLWLGVSVEDQPRADERIPDLLATPAAVRWISAEPLLGPVDLTRLRSAGGSCQGFTWLDCLNGREHIGPSVLEADRLDWIVCGGESGPGARPMHPDWARSLRDQCAAAGVPFFFKQWGSHRPTSDCQHGEYMIPATKKAAGRLLDGVSHDAMPAQSSAA